MSNWFEPEPKDPDAVRKTETDQLHRELDELLRRNGLRDD